MKVLIYGFKYNYYKNTCNQKNNGKNRLKKLIKNTNKNCINKEEIYKSSKFKKRKIHFFRFLISKRINFVFKLHYKENQLGRIKKINIFQNRTNF